MGRWEVKEGRKFFTTSLYQKNMDMRTKVKILQHHRKLDTNSFFPVKLVKQTKNCTSIFEGPIQILGMQGFSATGSKDIYLGPMPASQYHDISKISIFSSVKKCKAIQCINIEL